MGIQSVASAISNLGLGDISLQDDANQNDADAGNAGSGSALQNLDKQWLQHQLDVMGSLLGINSQTSSSLRLETAVLQNKLSVDVVSTLMGNLMKSVSRLEQING
ncbi:hypothetical protein DWU98_06465 [Dyella monticola]|uniref:Uncharacterized protein n=1 Tax=Dyella monticola TaxID=1927958 RepID=A0A370X3D2_9GAMM|nr:hypothetical protein [Dyella monticola]RDS82790.1 hypothetical protein DWU98_06465 [Dyella monticola]